MYLPKYAVNGAGLTNNLHTDFLNNNMWLTSTGTTGWFKVDLGNVYDLDQMKLWNFNWDYGEKHATGNGVRVVQVYVSNTNLGGAHNPANWGDVVINTAYNEAGGTSSEPSQDRVFPADTTGRYVLIDIDNNHGNSPTLPTQVGLSELQFFGSPPVPEPAGLGLIGLAMLVLKKRQR